MTLLQQVWTPYAWSDISEDVWIFSSSLEFKDTQYLTKISVSSQNNKSLTSSGGFEVKKKLKTLKPKNLKGRENKKLNHHNNLPTHTLKPHHFRDD